jgi:indole-3-glycerol phosphate synthase
MNILDEIIANKRIEIEQPGYFQTLEKVVDELPHVGTSCDECDGKPARTEMPDFIEALKSAPIGLIAEVKRQSPSAGPIREPFEPAAIARAYEAAGAQAVSCLMDSKYFGGGEKQWNEVRTATALPMLYKEFVIDPRQIFHAEALGASAVLLIVAALSDGELSSFIELVTLSGMTPLVEVHTEEEMKRAVAAEAKCIGINNRNLKTFETRIETTLRLRGLAPADCTLISESGIRTVDDIRALQAAGIAAVLVGESLLRRPDLQAAVKQLMGR